LQTRPDANHPMVPVWIRTLWHNLYFLTGLWFAVLALLCPFSEGEIRGRSGFLLVVTALPEMTHGFRRARWEDQKSAWASGAISMGLGMLLMNAPFFATRAIRLLIAGWFGIDVVRNLVSALRPRTVWDARQTALLAFSGNLAAMLVILLLQESRINWGLAAATATRIFLSGWNANRSPLMSADFSAESVDADFGFSPGSEVSSIVQSITSEECSRSAIDRSWIFSFLLTLFAIHLGRMGLDRTFLGLMSPAFAVMGDMFAALMLAFLVLMPILATTNRLTRGIESSGWHWSLAPARGRSWMSRVLKMLLTMRLRLAIRLRLARCSLSLAVSRIEELIAEATRLREEYRVPTQQQQAPYFQFQTESFALFAIDTGVTRRIDDGQKKWLEAALESAQGKTKMVILGHPFFAGGNDTTTDDPDFIELRTLFQQHSVSVVMAGDTHDLEYYQEPLGKAPTSDTGSPSVMHHFVNGGGGAYLSFGTALDWPALPVTQEWAFYPRRTQVESKIEATAPAWKRHAWLWTRKFGGWPFSAEWLSAAVRHHRFRARVSCRMDRSHARSVIASVRQPDTSPHIAGGRGIATYRRL